MSKMTEHENEADATQVRCLFPLYPNFTTSKQGIDISL